MNDSATGTDRVTAPRAGRLSTPPEPWQPDSASQTERSTPARMPRDDFGPKPRRVLVVDDDENLREAVSHLLAESGYLTDVAGDGPAALNALEHELYDVVLLDLSLPSTTGLDVLAVGRANQTDARFILMTAFGSVSTAVEAMKLGAFDYIEKPFRSAELLRLARRAIEDIDLRREVARLRLAGAARVRERIVGRSPQMHRVFSLVERVAPTRANVLITGETGTGKELVARAVHDASDRSHGPLVAINCSALPETLLESELFGHVKGAFTGAVQNKRGLFEEAANGTLLLDEASAMAEGTQVKLLRALQERRVRRVGSRQSIPVDFRLIVATNADLESLVEEGRFRRDLFYRLNVFPIHVPPLRERPNDIPVLANHFRLEFSRENGLEPPELAPETLRRMVAYDWPGNVRELENFMERSVIMYAGIGSIPFHLDRPGREPAEGTLLRRGASERWNLDRMEREYILTVLEDHRWHRTAAAESLGIDRRTLCRKLTRFRNGDGGGADG